MSGSTSSCIRSCRPRQPEIPVIPTTVTQGPSDRPRWNASRLGLYALRFPGLGIVHDVSALHRRVLGSRQRGISASEPLNERQRRLLDYLARHGRCTNRAYYEMAGTSPRTGLRDLQDLMKRGFVVRDRNLLTARWPGDAHRWSTQIDELLSER